MAWAHSANAAGVRHDLVEHLSETARLAERFASGFGGGPLARRVGLWHDIGKFARPFQEYLHACEQDLVGRRRGPDHKAAGARLAARHRLGLAALLIQGHHGGLRSPAEFQAWLARHEGMAAVAAATDTARGAMPHLEPPAPVLLPEFAEANPRAAELFLRMVFSALVDADFLDTERHFHMAVARSRSAKATIELLWRRLEASQQELSGRATDSVARLRHDVYETCLAAAEQPPGVFRLTVPTGGGKTRSAMGFALRHALQHGARRIVVAVPFISITEQTAARYRQIFETDGADPAVLEHHSMVLDADDELGDSRPDWVWRRLAAENWDAPVVVTTTVQLFESLFANRTSRVRKLHRLAQSVVILDEAQALPSSLLEPILDVLGELTRNYGTSVVLSTATQPAFQAIPPFAATPAIEIVPEPARLFRALDRVDYEWRIDPALAWAEVAELLRAESQVLAIVNTKRDALALLDALGDPDALHLSTLLCGAHRRKVLRTVEHRLAEGRPCRLISTQVVEAGVDLDFPVVLRALGPLDGIIQAAGRCNREGRLHRGRVVIFTPSEGGLPQGAYRTATQITAALLDGGRLDLGDPAVPEAYFKRLFETLDPDARQVQRLRERFDYPEVARRFRMIDGQTANVVVRYDDGAGQQLPYEAIEALRRGTPEARHLLRRLQPFVVPVPLGSVARYARQGLIVPVTDSFGEWVGVYDQVRGLLADDPDLGVLIA